MFAQHNNDLTDTSITLSTLTTYLEKNPMGIDQFLRNYSCIGMISGKAQESAYHPIVPSSIAHGQRMPPKYTVVVQGECKCYENWEIVRGQHALIVVVEYTDGDSPKCIPILHTSRTPTVHGRDMDTVFSHPTVRKHRANVTDYIIIYIGQFNFDPNTVSASSSSNSCSPIVSTIEIMLSPSPIRVHMKPLYIPYVNKPLWIQPNGHKSGSARVEEWMQAV